MHRQHIKKGQIIVHNLNAPLWERFKMRGYCGPYIITPCDVNEEKRSFYLDSDFMPDLRWQWCDDVTDNRIKHKGWYCDDDQHQTIRGVVFRLNHERGFLAGWSMGESMITILDVYIYDDELSAASAADSIAEYAAEQEREYQEKQENEL